MLLQTQQGKDAFPHRSERSIFVSRICVQDACARVDRHSLRMIGNGHVAGHVFVSLSHRNCNRSFSDVWSNMRDLVSPDLLRICREKQVPFHRSRVPPHTNVKTFPVKRYLAVCALSHSFVNGCVKPRFTHPLQCDRPDFTFRGLD